MSQLCQAISQSIIGILTKYLVGSAHLVEKNNLSQAFCLKTRGSEIVSCWKLCYFAYISAYIWKAIYRHYGWPLEDIMVIPLNAIQTGVYYRKRIACCLNDDCTLYAHYIRVKSHHFIFKQKDMLWNCSPWNCKRLIEFKSVT